jgi:hypothetical protein
VKLALGRQHAIEHWPAMPPDQNTRRFGPVAVIAPGASLVARVKVKFVLRPV